MKNVVVIGGLGVGMAHSIAATNVGFNVCAVIDTQVEKVKEKYLTDWWVNKWGNIEEKCKGHEIIVEQSVESFRANNYYLSKDIDIVLICVPDNFHNEIAIQAVSSFPKATFLCEKPGFLVSKDLKDYPIFIGYEWLFHSKIKPLLNKDLYSLAFVHDFPTDRPIIYDLGSHLLSMLFCSYPILKSKPMINIEIVDYIKRGNSVYVVIDFIAGTKHIFLTLSYKPRDFVNYVAGYRLPSLTREPVLDDSTVEVILNGEPLGWEQDLFQKQLLSLEKRACPISLEDSFLIDNILKKMHSVLLDAIY